MERQPKPISEEAKVSAKPSPVKAVISWLIEADREFRVAQSMVDDTHNKL